MDYSKAKSILRSRSVDVGGCWEWQGARFARGYGKVGWVFEDGTAVGLAHRASYLVFNGPISEGLMVCHTCDNRGCVNPAHLWLGSAADNHSDMVSKGRQPSKIDGGIAGEIRQEYLEGVRQVDLAEKYGVSQQMVSRIVRGEAWVTG